MDFLMEDRIQRCKNELTNLLVSHGIKEEIAVPWVADNVEYLVNNGSWSVRSWGTLAEIINHKHINRQQVIAALNDIIKRYSLDYYEAAKSEERGRALPLTEQDLEALEYFKSKCPTTDLTQEDRELYTVLIEGSVPWDAPSEVKVSAEDCQQFRASALRMGMGEADIEKYITQANTGKISNAVRRIIKTQEEIDARYRLNQNKLSDAAVSTNRWKK